MREVSKSESVLFLIKCLQLGSGELKRRVGVSSLTSLPGASFVGDPAVIADGRGLFDQHHAEFELGERVFPRERRHHHGDVASGERIAEFSGVHAFRAAASRVVRAISCSLFPLGPQSGGLSHGNPHQCEQIRPSEQQRVGSAPRDGGDDAAAAGDAGEAVDLLSGVHKSVLSERFAVQSKEARANES